MITTLRDVLPQHAADTPTKGAASRLRRTLPFARRPSPDRHGATARSRLLPVAIAAIAACLGAAAAYLLDPDRGRARRHRLADQGAARVRRQGRRAVARSRYARGRLQGRLHHAGEGTHEPVDDVAVKQLVHQALRRHGIPLADLSIEVSNRIAVLRGQAPNREQIDEIRQIVSEAPGVVDVLSFLHRPGEPAPNKVEALRLSHSPD